MHTDNQGKKKLNIGVLLKAKSRLKKPHSSLEDFGINGRNLDSPSHKRNVYSAFYGSRESSNKKLTVSHFVSQDRFYN
jgi:hypothetical protein